MRRALLFASCLLGINSLLAQVPKPVHRLAHMVPVAKGWAKNSVNAVIFRHNALVSFRDTQYIAFYNEDQHVVLGKRTLGSDKWQLQVTPYTGHAADAHNTISIMVDGDDYLHLSWDHHSNDLHYCRSVRPGSLQMTSMMPMTGKKEHRVTYPEFYRLPGGDLLFFYRDGSSGNGNLMLDHYDLHTRKWTQVQDGWIDGEGRRNAYWQVAIDDRGTIHLSWVWRETSDVATNHDICYARSRDGGRTWEKSTGEKYRLPITAATAEYAWHIPQNSELINQTSMAADGRGHPYIATYWRAAGTTVPQYRLVYDDGHGWHTQQISHRTEPFSLSGGGTKRIPISRPQILVSGRHEALQAYMLYRDLDEGDKVSLAFCHNIAGGKWGHEDLTEEPVGLWEPTYDTELWRNKKILDVFVEKVEQGDAELTENIPPQPIAVLEWTPSSW